MSTIKHITGERAYSHASVIAGGISLQQQQDLRDLAKKHRISSNRRDELVRDFCGTDDLMRLPVHGRPALEAIFEKEGARTKPQWDAIEAEIDSLDLDIPERERQVLTHRLAFDQGLVDYNISGASHISSFGSEAEHARSAAKYDRLVNQIRAKAAGADLCIKMRWSCLPASLMPVGQSWYGETQFASVAEAQAFCHDLAVTAADNVGGVFREQFIEQADKPMIGDDRLLSQMTSINGTWSNKEQEFYRATDSRYWNERAQTPAWMKEDHDEDYDPGDFEMCISFAWIASYLDDRAFE